MKKVLILGANSYIGNSFQKYIGENYNDQYEVHKVSLRGEAWKEDDWSGYDSILNVTGKAHADIGILTEEQKQEYYAVNCDLACEAAQKAVKDGVGQYIYLSSLEADGIIYDCNPCRNVCGRVFINGLRRTRSSLHYGILPVPEKQNTAGRVWMSGICMVGMGSSVCIRSNLLLQWKTWLWNEIFLLRILSGASADPVSDRI